MHNLYVTSDTIGNESGGGAVTYNELEALRQIGETDVINPKMTGDPFAADQDALNQYISKNKHYDLAHFYAGTFSKLIDKLKKDGTKVTYTCAAHDVKISKEEFEKLGMNFAFPHLTDPELFNQYLGGYRNADVVISPSTHSKKVLIEQGCKTIEIIPHGHNLPKEIKDLPSKFVVGSLGAIGPDKGLIYLIQAWAKLNYKDSTLIMAGRDTPALLPLVRQVGGGAINLIGWVKHTSDFYNRISCLCQPSASEGFGIEVLEAMAHGRPVVCSDGAGAADVATVVVPRRDVDALANAIDNYKNNPDKLKSDGLTSKEKTTSYTWDKIREQYVKLWMNILA